MINRNATRHLLLVASILLCAFIYAGYALSRRGGDSAEPAPRDTAGLRPPAGAAIPSGNGDALSLLPPPGGAARLPAPPPAAPAASSGAGAITGLVPETAGGDSGVPRGTALPLPAFSDAPEEEESVPPPVLAPPGMESGTDEAGNGFRYDETGEAEDGDFAALPGFDSPEESPAPAALPPPPAPAGAPAGAGTALRPPPSSLPPAPSGGGTAAAGSGEPVPAGAGSAPERTPPPAPASSSATPPPLRPLPGRGPDAGREGDASSDSLRIYVVAPGDTLSSIALRELGSGFLADNIFLLNRDVIDDPNHLTVGVKIRLPYAHSSPDADASGAPPAPPAGDAAARRPAQGAGATHTVERGDTLSSIALRYYGTSSGWRFLYEANRAVVPNPNQLSVGMELTIPPYGE